MSLWTYTTNFKIKRRCSVLSSTSFPPLHWAGRECIPDIHVKSFLLRLLYMYPLFKQRCFCRLISSTSPKYKTCSVLVHTSANITYYTQSHTYFGIQDWNHMRKGFRHCEEACLHVLLEGHSIQKSSVVGPFQVPIWSPLNNSFPN